MWRVMEAGRLNETTHPRYVISVAARLAGVTPAQLRGFERAGLIKPARTEGRVRLYSDADLDRTRRIAELRDRGVNLAGIDLILEMEEQSRPGVPVSGDGQPQASEGGA